PLIDYETRRPRCACRIRNQRLALGVSEPRRPKIRLPHNHPRVPQQDRGRAMSGPLLTGGRFRPSLDLTLDGGVLATARLAEFPASKRAVMTLAVAAPDGTATIMSPTVPS